MQRLRPLSEDECYLRCYGQRRREEPVRVLPGQPTSAPENVSAELIRRLFDTVLDTREPEAA